MSKSRTTSGIRATARRAFVAALAALLFAAAPAGAAIIAEWDLANATGQSAVVLAAAADVTATPITASAGVTPWNDTSEDGFIAASGWAPGAAADPTKYYEWSVTAAPGVTISYQTLTLALFRGIQGSDHGAELWDLRASTDGFGASNVLLQTFDISSSGVDEQVVFAGADISAIGAVVGTLTFRLYGYDYTSAADFSGLGNDSGWLIAGTGANPVVEGDVTTTTPEPDTAMLLTLGLLAFGLRRPRS